MMRSSVDRPGVKPLCCGRCFAKIALFIRARHIWAKTLAGTDRSDMPRHFAQSDSVPFPFQSGRIMARFESVGMTQYFQISVKRGSTQLISALAASVMMTGSSGGAGLLNRSWKWYLHMWSWSVFIAEWCSVFDSHSW